MGLAKLWDILIIQILQIKIIFCDCKIGIHHFKNTLAFFLMGLAKLWDTYLKLGHNKKCLNTLSREKITILHFVDLFFPLKIQL